MSSACRRVITELGSSPYLLSAPVLLSSDARTSLAYIILYPAGTVTSYTTHQGASSHSGAERTSVKKHLQSLIMQPHFLEVESYHHLVCFAISVGLHVYQ